MRRRADVDDALPPVAIPAPILNDLYKQARETAPEECCGLIVGDASVRYQRVEPCRNEMTQRHDQDPETYPRDGREAFYMNQVDYLRAAERAERDGIKVTAVYHSHVDSAVYLSEMDLEYAESGLFPFPEADQIVISVLANRVAGVGVFQRPFPSSPFAGRNVGARLS